MSELQEIQQLRDLWLAAIQCGDVPVPAQFHVWLSQHSPDILTWAIEKTGRRSLRNPMTLDHAVRWVSKLCNRETFRTFRRWQKRQSEAA